MSIFDFSVIVFVLQTKPRQTDCTAAPSMSFIRVLARLVRFFASDLTANMCGRCNLDGVSGRWQPGSNCNAEHFQDRSWYSIFGPFAHCGRHRISGTTPTTTRLLVLKGLDTPGKLYNARQDTFAVFRISAVLQRPDPRRLAGDLATTGYARQLRRPYYRWWSPRLGDSILSGEEPRHHKYRGD